MLDFFVEPIGHMAFLNGERVFFNPPYGRLSILETVFEMGKTARKVISREYLEKAIEAEKEAQKALYDILVRIRADLPYKVGDMVNFTPDVFGAQSGRVLHIAIPINVLMYSLIDEGIYLYCRLSNRSIEEDSPPCAYVNTKIVLEVM